MFRPISKFFAHLFMPLLVWAELRTKKAKSIKNEEQLTRYVYNRHDKVYKKYDIPLSEIEKRVKPRQRVGIGGSAVLWKARQVIRSRIKAKRIVFLSDNTVEYTDRQGVKATMYFGELAKTFLDKTGQRDNMAIFYGLGEAHIIKIIEDEYRAEQNRVSGKGVKQTNGTI